MWSSSSGSASSRRSSCSRCESGDAAVKNTVLGWRRQCSLLAWERFVASPERLSTSAPPVASQGPPHELTICLTHSMHLMDAALPEQGLNTELYWKNPDARTYANIVPTSAITGEGGSCTAERLQAIWCQHTCSAALPLLLHLPGRSRIAAAFAEHDWVSMCLLPQASRTCCRCWCS